MASNRNLPENFAKGLTVDATRIERNIEEMDKLNSVPDHLLARRMVPSWLTWGYMPDLTASPLELPWLRQKNSIDISPIYTAPTIHNEFRHKSIAVPGITFVGPSNYYTWEVAFQTSTPTYLSKILVFLAMDAYYLNAFQYGVNAPPTKTTGDFVNDMTVQVLVDDVLDPEDRTRTTTEVGSYQANLGQSNIRLVPAVPIVDTMLPAHPQGEAKGTCVEINCKANLPAGRIRICVTIPRYDIADFDSDWGDRSWQNVVWSMCAKLSEAVHV